MTTSQNVPDADVAADSSGWMLRVVGVAVLVAVVATVLSVAAGPFSSRFWAQRVAGLVGGGAYPSGGVVVGFVLGALSTTVALFATLVSSMAWRRRGGGPGLALCSGFLALVAMLPVAGTLVIALGIGSYGGARTAQQILDVDAPGYSEAAVAGIAAGFGAYTLVSAVFAYRLRRTFGPVREAASSPCGVVGYTAGGQPVYAPSGFTTDGHPVTSDQLDGRYPGVARTGTNILAIVALVLGLVGGVLAIPFGHIALSQIRRSGEQGACVGCGRFGTRLPLACRHSGG